MKRIIFCISLFAFFGSQAQQINPVPDYVFSNKMSVGRNAVTDTAAYFSIGPRYGAIRGMMPPMVTDTASMSATKRNGLLIFSIQKNKYLYWDSVGSKWAEMAGTAGSAITGSGVAGYMPEFTTSTNIDTTRLYHSAGRFAIGSTTTTNGVFNVYGGRAYFDTSVLIGGTTLFANEAMNEVSIGTTTGFHALTVRTRTQASQPTRGIGLITSDLDSATSTGSRVQIGLNASTGNTTGRIEAFQQFGTAANLFLNPGGAEVIAGTGTDAGSYTFQIGGSFYNTGAGFLAANGFNDVRIGSTSGRQISGVAAGMLQVWDNPGNFGGITINGQNANNAFGANLQFIKSRGTGNTALQQSDGLGGLMWGGADGTNIIRAASIEAIIDAAPGTNDMPSSLFFSTTSDGGTIPIERMRITSAGEVLIGTTTDAGAYVLQVAGSIYNTTGAVLAASSGNVGIGTTSATDKLRVIGTIRGDVTRSETYSQFQYWYPAFSNMSTTNATPANYATTLNGTLYFRQFDVSQGAGLNSVGWSLGVHDSNNDYGYSWQMLSDFSGNIALRAASSSTTWKSPYMIWKDGGNVGIGTTSPSERLHVNGNIITAAPSGGTAKPFKIGAAATVSPTSPNRTIEIEIDGTTYYLHAKTTNN